MYKLPYKSWIYNSTFIGCFLWSRVKYMKAFKIKFTEHYMAEYSDILWCDLHRFNVCLLYPLYGHALSKSMFNF